MLCLLLLLLLLHVMITRLAREPLLQVAVAGEKWVEVACGGMHTVALSSQGEVWTWGVNDEGALGRKTGVVCRSSCACCIILHVGMYVHGMH